MKTKILCTVLGLGVVVLVGIMFFSLSIAYVAIKNINDSHTSTDESIKQDKFDQWEQYKNNNDCKLIAINSITNGNKWHCNKNQVEVINNFLE